MTTVGAGKGRRRWLAWGLLAGLASGCADSRGVEATPRGTSDETGLADQGGLAQPASEPSEDAPSSQPSPLAPAAPASSRAYGAPLGGRGPGIPVQVVLDDPPTYLGKVLQVEGQVARVCERAGCWLELSPAGAGRGLRVPMAGHAFFIPQEAVGETALVEGKLLAAPLPEGHKAHLAAEGAQALGPLSLEATSVVLK